MLACPLISRKDQLTMTDLINKFSEAAKAVKNNTGSNWESVKRAFGDYLSDISINLLPEQLQIFFDSVRLRVTTAEILGDIDNDEASYIAQDILYMADVINSGLKKSDEIEAVS